MPSSGPRVTVVTPFFNTAEHLAECIESVLSQSYGDFDYVLADNSSTDGSRQIAESYAQQDPRVHFVAFDEHLPQLANYNRALSLASGTARYCKVAQADDVLLPDCLAEMVAVAEEDDSIVLVGAYAIEHRSLVLTGLDWREHVFPGEEICRRYLLGGRNLLGSPTTCMYRMSEVKARPEFYPEQSVAGDAEVAMDMLQGKRFGFVHQVLSLVRTDERSISGRARGYRTHILARRILMEKYGPRVFDPQTFKTKHWRWAVRHYEVLGEGLLLRQPKSFWELHRRGLKNAGLRFRVPMVMAGAVLVVLRWLLNLESVISRRWPEL